MKVLSIIMAISINFSGLAAHINPKYKPHFEDFRYYQIFKGGGSAGKSVFIAQRAVYRTTALQGYNGLVVRKTGRTNHDSCFQELKKWIYAFGLSDLFKINESRGMEEILSLVSRNKIIFRGLDNIEKVKSSTFETGPLVWVWIEEASEITEEDLIQLQIRLRGLSNIPKHIIMSFNPIDVDSWIKGAFFDKKLDPKDGFICESTYKDNLFLTDEDRYRLESLKNIDYYHYQVYVLNKWGNRAGTKVFHNYTVHDFDANESYMQNIRHGLDFGYNHAQALVGSGYRDGELYIHKEVHERQTKNNDFIKLVDNIGLPKEYYIIGDAARPDLIREWCDEGYLVSGCHKEKNILKMAVDYFKSLPKIHIHATNCPKTAKEFAGLKYRQLKDGMIIDELVEINDDGFAALRYGNEDFVLNGYSERKGSNFSNKGVV